VRLGELIHVSLLVARGLDPRSIADRVGHTNPSFTLDVYSHMFAQQRQNAAVGMADLLGTDTRQRAVN
jgi:integrase